MTADRSRLEYVIAHAEAVVYSARTGGGHATTFISDSVREQLGYAPGAFLADPRFWSSCLHPEDAPRVLDALSSPPEQGHFCLDYRFRHHDGSYRWIHDALKLVRDEAGQPAEFVGFMMDITERKQKAEQIQLSEALHRLVLSSISDTVLITDDAGRLVYICPNVATIFGYSVEEVSAFSNIARLLGAHMVEGLEWDGAQEIANIECAITDRAGTARELLVNVKRVAIAAGTRLYTCRDITERKRAEQERLEAQRLQAQISQEREILDLKERFIYAVSHEFRMPLTVVLTSAEIVRLHFDSLPRERSIQKLEQIETQVKYLVSLLDEVLLISQGRSGRLHFNPGELDLADFCRSLFEELQMIDTTGHHYVFDARAGRVYADKTLLRHILANLLSNAIKYSPQGGEIRLEIEQAGDETVFRISDQGVGIPEADLKYLFEPFFRATNSREIRGTGLGLAIVKESVDAHGGAISCESRVNTGTTFTVRLPLYRAGSEV